jgi:hypothetical protein
MVKNSCETVASGNNTSKLVSKIVKQISHRRISISLRQLLEIVKPEIGLEIIDLIANPDIAKKQCVISVGSKSHDSLNRLMACSAIKKKKCIHNYSSSSSSTESGSEYSSIEIRTQVLKAKKRN